MRARSKLIAAALLVAALAVRVGQAERTPYTPTNDVKDGSYRHLEIRLASKDLKAQARKGYYAVKPEGR